MAAVYFLKNALHRYQVDPGLNQCYVCFGNRSLKIFFVFAIYRFEMPLITKNGGSVTR